MRNSPWCSSAWRSATRCCSCWMTCSGSTPPPPTCSSTWLGDSRTGRSRRAAAREIDWQQPPARVEGVIENRIGRLDPELREVLGIASVQGEVFTAEAVARVQGVDERALVRRLSWELERQERLGGGVGGGGGGPGAGA